MSKQKSIAKDFLLLTAKGASREAFELYVAKDFVHHNAYFNAGRETLLLAMEESAQTNPARRFEVKRLIEEDDCVVAHSFIQQNETDAGYAVVHIFRFQQQKIVELWDVIQQIPEQEINENGMF